MRHVNAFTKVHGLAVALPLDVAIETTTTVKILIVLLKLVTKVQEIAVAIRLCVSTFKMLHVYFLHVLYKTFSCLNKQKIHLFSA